MNPECGLEEDSFLIMVHCCCSDKAVTMVKCVHVDCTLNTECGLEQIHNAHRSDNGLTFVMLFRWSILCVV